MTVAVPEPDIGLGAPVSSADQPSLHADPWSDGWSLPTVDEVAALGVPGARTEAALHHTSPALAADPDHSPELEKSVPFVLLTSPRDVSRRSGSNDRARPPKRLKGEATRAAARRRPGRRQASSNRPIGRIRVAAMTLATAYWFYALATLALAMAIPLVTGWESTTIMSNSMAPTLSQGDVVIFDEPDGSLLAPGAIIQFEDPARPGSTLTHRIVSVGPSGTYETKGDANAGPDSAQIPVDSVVGVARVVVPFAGLPHFWLESGQYLWLAGWIAFTALAAIAMVPPRSARTVPKPNKQEPLIRPADRLTYSPS